MTSSAHDARARQPNFIVVLCDDLGYSDIGPLGGTIPTPELDRMAAEGLVATDYYAPANICTPSRAGLLTGRYPVRTGLGFEVIFQGDDRCLPSAEKTIADALKPDYVAGLFGKWHLGHTGPDWLPTRHGFDTFFGIPYSHDMLPLEVYAADAATGDVSSVPADFVTLQQQFYAHAERFIEEHRERPFFCELALSAPHLPEYPFGEFAGSSDAGPYGDVVREIDSIVGRLLDKVKQLGLERDTVVVFTSDNGPWYEGSSTPLRDRKGGTAYDGGFRVPLLAWAPGRIAPGTTTSAIACGIDLLPTFCSMAGVAPPPGVELDGLDISGVLTNRAASPHDEILLFDNEEVVGIRTQRWKYVTHTYYRSLRINMERAGYSELYDVSRDITESYSVAERHQDIAAEMRTRIQRARERFAPFKRGVPPFIQELRKKGLHRFQD
jgi:arylsulfatase A-like enzyme